MGRVRFNLGRHCTVSHPSKLDGWKINTRTIDGRGFYLFEYEGKKFYTEDLVRAFKAVGIAPGDKVFVHSDVRSFGKVNPELREEAYLGAFVAALKSLVGKKGTIIMPTFSYSFPHGEVYDPQKTPSTVGSLTEHFRKLEEVVRTLDPIFSVAIWGANRTSYQEVGSNCFGDESIFQKIRDADFKMVFLGENFALTYLHFIEQDFGVPYRFIKTFAGKILIDGKLVERTFEYFVRPLDGSVRYDLERLARFLDSRGVLRKSKLGYASVRLVRAQDAYRIIARELQRDPRFLLKNKDK